MSAWCHWELKTRKEMEELTGERVYLLRHRESDDECQGKGERSKEKFSCGSSLSPDETG